MSAVALTSAPTTRGRRSISYAAVGLAVMGLGYLVLFALVEGLGWSAHLAYFVQALISVELNFVLNRRLTWGDRREHSSAKRQWLRFHASRVVTIPANQALFSLLTLAGAGYLAANTVCLGLTFLVNYAIAHFWVFSHANR
ncbi:GtrA family protein [Solirubrobacter soli]|uniref:GtrA family protein n=1 Tax=Solirubrobacter soli TaxID=363832 RepID=UPI0004013982|nr:GtrA family protein [Solirubrobacter soli]